MRRAIAIAGTVVAAPWAAGAQAPLDVTDPTPRPVRVEIERSIDLSEVGQSFGPPRPATWSASGNTGTLTISAATHEQMRIGGGYTAVPGSFDPIVIEIDLTTLEATSQPASGAIESGVLSIAFTQNALGSTTFGGFIGPDVEPFYCTSQEQVAQACLVAPEFCDQACIIVPGAPYDPATGLVNLIGPETQTPCDGGQCFGPYDFFAANGDLRLTEVEQPPAVPALPWLALLALGAGLSVLARLRPLPR